MHVKKPLRLIIDTNLWVSFLISHRQDRLDKLMIHSETRILFSNDLLDEIAQTINKPKIKKYFSSHALDKMLESLEHFIEFIEVVSVVNICRDSDDDFLLELAKDGRADFLLTGDKDLLELRKFGKTKICTIADFLESVS